MEETRRFAEYLQKMNQTLTQESETTEARAVAATTALHAAEQAVAGLRADLDQRNKQLADALAARSALAAEAVRCTACACAIVPARGNGTDG